MRHFYRVTVAEQQLVLRVAAILAVPLALVMLLPSLFGLWLVNREADIRSHENRTLIQQMRNGNEAGENVLVALVCESIAIRFERGDPSAEAFAARFGNILQGIGRSCP